MFARRHGAAEECIWEHNSLSLLRCFYFSCENNGSGRECVPTTAASRLRVNDYCAITRSHTRATRRSALQ
jgi:hypothetical protein